jgi:DNA-directed RNA polymerase specialized sigma24 family protein
VVQVRKDPASEFDWWFRSSYASVARTVYLVLGDSSQAEDIAQDAFLAMYQHWSTVSRYERPDAWARRVAVRMAVKRARREGSRRQKERTAVEGTGDGVVDPVLPDPALAEAVSRLSPMQRAAVVLFYWQDHSVFEVARALEVSESTVKQHLHRARHRLAELLGEEVSGDVAR